MIASGKDEQRDRVKPVLRQRPRRGGALIFLLVFTGMALTIAATVLLSNNAQHLKQLLLWFDIDWPPARIAAPGKSPVQAKTDRPAPATIDLPPRFFNPPDVAVAGVFLREMRDLGPQVCKDFTQIGIDNNGWRQSPLDRSTFECLSDEPATDGTGARGSAEPSLFFIAKGDPDGEIRSIRMKLVLADSAQDPPMRQRMIDGVKLLEEQTGWRDLSQFVDSIATLKDLVTSHSGMSYSFQREFTDPHRFNLIVMATNKLPTVKRSRAYFDRKDWLPAAPHSPQRWPFVETPKTSRPEMPDAAVKPTGRTP